MNIRPIFAGLIAAVLIAAPVDAQDAPAAAEIKAEDVDIGMVVSFVNAMIAVERVKAAYTPQIENAETEEERKELAKKADEDAIAAVDATVGITPAEYLGVIKAAQRSEELTARINARVEELLQN